MELINQHTKEIMEGCKERAKEAGLSFTGETLEYIVSNRDLLELSPKVMIPTLYDYWVHDVEVLKGKGQYELYPHNPYETVINTRPPISFYNDNNPDWLNVMIFYHVLAHIDFFQNNQFYRHTWDIDFTGQALSDKRLITKLRSEHGRWVDYVIEFARSIDNMAGYHEELSGYDRSNAAHASKRFDYYFDVFLQSIKKVPVSEYIKELEKYNDYSNQLGAKAESAFFAEVNRRCPEFEQLFEKNQLKGSLPYRDIPQFLLDNSAFLNRSEHKWMKSVIEIIRKTSIFFQPQIRTKIMNEGWASYWHDRLFLQDERIRGHEVDYARVNAGVTSMPRVGLNPYALGMRLFIHLEELGDKGKYSFDFTRLTDAVTRQQFDRNKGKGKELVFQIREHLCDSLFINSFVDQDFITRNNLFVAGKRLNETRQVWEYYVKSRKAEAYRTMLQDSLYHPPHITIEIDRTEEGPLYLMHHFEGKPLVQEFIADTMMGIEYFWDRPVLLETSEVSMKDQSPSLSERSESRGGDLKWQRVLYSMENRKLSRKEL
jgi:stage V sporulation protein R